MQFKYSDEYEYDKEIGNVKFFSKRKMKKLYPNSEFQLIGEIGPHKKASCLGQMEHDGKEIDYYMTGSYNKFSQNIAGYVMSDDGVALAVIKSCLIKRIFQLLLLCILLGAVAFYIYNFEKVRVDPSAQAYKAQVNVNTDKEHIAVPGFEELRLTAGETHLYAAMWNPDENPCYFRYTINLVADDDSMLSSDKVLARTGLIPPGQAITDIELSQSFKKGSYKIRIDVDTFSLEDMDQSLNNSVVETTLRVTE